MKLAKAPFNKGVTPLLRIGFNLLISICEIDNTGTNITIKITTQAKNSAHLPKTSIPAFKLHITSIAKKINGIITGVSGNTKVLVKSPMTLKIKAAS